MYEKNLPNRQGLTPQFQDGVIAFIEWAKSQHAYMDGDKIRCLCRKCKNKLFKVTDEVNFDLYMKDFIPEYYNWTSHGEERVQEYFEAVTAPLLQDEVTSTQLGDATHINWAQRMVLDAAGPTFCSSTYRQDCAPDDVSGLADQFHDVLHVAPLWNDCTTSQLATVAELVDIKADGHIPQRIYDRICQWGDHTMLRDHTLPLDYYNMKKLIKDLGLPMEKIDACNNGCILYWKDDIDLDYCKFCGTARYKSTRVRNPTFSHPECACNGRKTCYFDCHRQFLPPDQPYRRNKKAFTKNQVERKVARPRLTGEQIRDWVEEFSVAVEALLSHPDGYGSEHKWSKKSIFWELEYWSMHLIRHNLDVMHIEKNVFDNIFNTVMDIKGKMKDNLIARKDLQIICNRPELEVDKRRPYVMPKAVYTLTRDQKKSIFEWITSLMFPDDVNKVQELEDTVPIIMCNLEKNFSLSFFDSMEHLIVHLLHEALVGGPIQYRWMYPFERFLRGLKMKVKNKAHVEASIVEAYLVEEIGLFCSQYFEPQVLCKRNRPGRNDVLTMNDTYPTVYFQLSGTSYWCLKEEMAEWIRTTYN
ncbi:UNVERIFIED_CONTAM: hypothetical protein Sradi_3986000 [Sesamum radiatum]|uniref:Uncharacterized protein n=1 Tax=Sesamum radiatum TaxID=300843 RepID=A0AAW2PLJ5_SESRA